jgi:hypothetical protein
VTASAGSAIADIRKALVAAAMNTFMIFPFSAMGVDDLPRNGAVPTSIPHPEFEVGATTVLRQLRLFRGGSLVDQASGRLRDVAAGILSAVQCGHHANHYARLARVAGTARPQKLRAFSMWPLDSLCPVRDIGTPRTSPARPARDLPQSAIAGADHDRFHRYHESVRGFSAMAQP